jgi:hypothetical protein
VQEARPPHGQSDSVAKELLSPAIPRFDHRLSNPHLKLRVFVIPLRRWQQGTLDTLLKVTDEFVHLKLVALVEQVAELMEEERLESKRALFQQGKK